MRLELGCPIRCTDAVFGELDDIVIDPISRRVTHLVAAPHHRHGLARLIPVDLVQPADGQSAEITVERSVDEVRRLEPVQEFAYLRVGEFPLTDPDWEVGIDTLLSLPYFATPDIDDEPVNSGSQGYDSHVGMDYDRIPRGDVEIRRASAVRSCDRYELGHVDGFLVDADEQISHLVLQRGHLWGTRQVTIPIATVAKVETDKVTLMLDKDAVQKLPSLPVHRWRHHDPRTR